MSIENDQQKKLDETRIAESRTETPATGDSALDLAREQLSHAKQDTSHKKTDQVTSERTDAHHHEAPDRNNLLDATRIAESRYETPATGDSALDLAREQLSYAKQDTPYKKTDQLTNERTDGHHHEAPDRNNRLEAARLGQAAHSDYFAALRESREMGGGWKVWKIDETVGDKNRPDVVYVNDEQKRVVVEDLYTGTKTDVQTSSGPESKTHNEKGWNYSNEPMIQDYINKGYSFEYVNAPWDPRKKLDALN